MLYLSASNGVVCYLDSVLATAILSDTHRWNPHADVAELVDALVSGSSEDPEH